MVTLSLSLFSYGLLVFTLIRLPDKCWDFLLTKCSYMLTLFSLIKKKLPFYGEISLGEDLLLGLQEYEAKVAFGLKILPKYLARYKFSEQRYKNI